MAINVIVADQERTFADVLAARLDDEDDIEVLRAVQVQAPGLSLLTGKSADVMLLDGKTAIVYGAGGAIGSAVARD